MYMLSDNCTVATMAITDCEEVCMRKAKEICLYDIGILILLLAGLAVTASFGTKAVLVDHVVKWQRWWWLLHKM